jgi:hypothetical protein
MDFQTIQTETGFQQVNVELNPISHRNNLMVEYCVTGFKRVQIGYVYTGSPILIFYFTNWHFDQSDQL